MAFTSGCNHPSFTLPWRTLLPYLVALHLLHPGSAQQRVVAPSLRVTANVGQDVVLRCHLSPCKDAWNSDIRWIQQRSSGIVHHYRNGVDLGQMEEYKGRTELLRKGLSDGNLDLRITAVSTSDSGSYRCAVQDDDGYADAVVELEVSDPFSQIVHPWKVALPVVVTILVGSFVIIVFLYRKKAAQSRELKRKDAALGSYAANLKNLASKLNENADEVENYNLELKKDCEEIGYGFADLKKLAAELEIQCAVFWILDAKLYNLGAKLVHQSKQLEKQHSQFQRHFKHMDFSVVEQKKLVTKLEKQNSQFHGHFQHIDSRAGKQKKLVTKLEEHCEQMERRNVKLEAPAVKVGQQAKESEKQKSELKERHEEMAEQTEAVVVATEESVGDTEESVADTEESVGDTEESVGDTEESVGDTEESVADTEESEKPSEELD